MNERIKELIRKATPPPHRDHGYNGQPSYVYPSLLDVEKFAELIIQECIDTGSQAFLKDNSTIPVFPTKQIKEHFGVEE